MKIQVFLCCIVIATFLICPGQVRSAAEEGPLHGFGPLIGGQWHLDGSYMELEWGVGRQSVRSRSYFIVDGKPKLVSEGLWYWHPGEEKIKGLFTAIDMPVTLFEYTTQFESETMINNLRSYGADGQEFSYVETWELVDETHFEWNLLRETADGLEVQMSGAYVRR